MKSEKNVGIIVIAVVLTTVTLLLAMTSGIFNSGSIPQSNINFYSGNKLDKAIETYDDSLYIPDFIQQEMKKDKSVNYSVLGSDPKYFRAEGKRFLYQINNTVVYGSNLDTEFIDYDNLNLIINASYECKNGVYKYVRYRANYSIAIIDTYTQDSTYTLIMLNYDGINGMDTLLSEFKLDSSNLEAIDSLPSNETDIVEDSSMEEEANTQYRLYEYPSLGISFNFLDFGDNEIIESISLLKNSESNDKVILIYEGKIILIVEQTITMSKDRDTKFNYIDTDSGYTFEYFKDNPYTPSDSGYEYFEYMMKNIDDIANSIKIME